MRLVLLNGALRGDHGNTAVALSHVARRAPPDVAVDTITLADFADTTTALLARLTDADAFLVGSGVYWGGPGSPLQRFLELASVSEATSVWIGKPVAVVTTADAYGGVEVAARLLATFVQWGCAVPPFGLVALSRAALALDDASAAAGSAEDDLFRLADLEVCLANLLALGRERLAYRAWRVAPLRAPDAAYPSVSALDLGSTRFLHRE